ncbi:MAG: aminotransferase class I/II-fold pyridoxal phosphate-dependent enzyme [Christensenellales bacterium]|jgi:LL-diaminopimelate aminotransferase
MRFSSRMDKLETGIFNRLSDIKQQVLAKGRSVIDLSVGTPNIPPSQEIIDALIREARDPAAYVYALTDTAPLQEAAALWYARRYSVTIDPTTEVQSLLGSQDGLAHLSMVVGDAGDIVLAPDPGYPIFSVGPMIAGMQVYPMPLRRENAFLVDFSAIPHHIAQKARLMILSYPNNPVAKLAPPQFYQQAIAFAAQHNIIILHDNAYSELVFDGKEGGSFLSHPGAKDVGIEFNSLSKTYGLAGARIGFALGNRDIIARLKQFKSNIDYGMFLPLQKAAIAAITGDQSNVATTREAYQRRRDVLVEEFCSIGWNIEKSEGTMFVWAKLPNGRRDSTAFTLALAKEAGVIVVPGISFGPGGEGYVRLALVQEEEAIRQAAAQIRASNLLP